MQSAPEELPDGLQKSTVRRPPTEKYLQPQDGDKVVVHYVLSLEITGEVLDSSRARGNPFEFTVGAGEVIRGWEEATKLMRKGEVAKWTVAPSLAFGNDGDAGRGVPPASVVLLELEIVSCPQREDLFEDGAAIKLETKSGTGQWEPRSNEEVQISYKVVVDGDVIAGSRHAVYHLGTGALARLSEVIDKALMTMKRGDEATLTCLPRYAFGSEGRYANKTAKITLILEEIFEVLDVTFGEKDRTIMKKRVKEGEGTKKAHDTATVTLRVTSVSAAGEPVGGPFPREITFAAGDGEVCDALECAVIEMRKGEEALLRCSQGDWCSDGRLGLPDKLQPPVMIQMAMVDFNHVPERWDMDDKARIERCLARKEVAAGLFKKGRLRLAAHHYTLITLFFAQAETFTSVEDQKAGRELRRTAQVNKAMCALKFCNWTEAVELCTSALKEDPCHAKALYRRATAQLQLKEYASALSDCHRLLEVEPSTEGRQLLQRAQKLKKEFDRKQAPVFSRMCEALGTLPERTNTTEQKLVSMPDALRLGYRPEVPSDPQPAVSGEIPVVATSRSTGSDGGNVSARMEVSDTGETPGDETEFAFAGNASVSVSNPTAMAKQDTVWLGSRIDAGPGEEAGGMTRVESMETDRPSMAETAGALPSAEEDVLICL